VARVVSVLKVTTTPDTAAPVLSLNVPFTVAGAPAEIELTVAPAALLSVSVSVGGLDGAGIAV
jgi:hypothetical protein